MIQVSQWVDAIANVWVYFLCSILKGVTILVFCFSVVSFILIFCQFTIVLKGGLYLDIRKGMKLLHLVEV